MIGVDKAKDWVRENAPMFNVLFENKYIGMLYDRFGSLPVAKQKQVIVGGGAAILGILVLHLTYSYVGLWSYHSKTNDSLAMITMLREYQTQEREQSAEMRLLERNSALSGEGNLKSHLNSVAKNAGISPRMIQAEESNDGGSDLQMKRATVKLQRVTILQLKNFMQGVEFGAYSLEVSSIKIKNDDKIRGYQDIELGVVAYLFAGTGEGL